MFRRLRWLGLWIVISVGLMWATESSIVRLLISVLAAGLLVHFLKNWGLVRRQHD